MVFVGYEACLGYHAVEGAGNVEQGIAYDVGVAFGGFDAFVAQ